MGVNVKQEKSEPGEVVLRVEVDSELYERHLASATQRVSQRVDIPGFRKGKAPRALIQNFVGKDYLVEETIESLVPDAVAIAVEQEDLSPFATPRVDVTETDPVVVLSVTVPLAPDAVLGDYQSIRLDDEVDEITEETVDEAIDRIRRTQAYLQPAERPAEIGDVVTMSVNAMVGETQLFNVEDQEFFLREGATVPFERFYEGIAGLSPGDDKFMQLEVPAALSNEELAGETADISVSVSEVKQEILPPLDDGLAAIYGEDGVETLDELRASLREALEEEAENRLIRVLETKVVDAIVENSEFHISPIIVEREGRHMLEHEIERRQQLMGRRPQPIRADDIPSETFEQAEQASETRIKRSLVIEKLAEAEDVEVSDEEVLDEINRANESAAPDAERLEDNEETRESVRRYLSRQKSLSNAVQIARGTTEPNTDE